MSASSNRGAGASTRASGTTDSAMRANPSRVGRRVAAAFAASASLEPPHRANAGRHERLASALIDAPSLGACARAPVTTRERHQTPSEHTTRGRRLMSQRNKPALLKLSIRA